MTGKGIAFPLSISRLLLTRTANDRCTRVTVALQLVQTHFDPDSDIIRLHLALTYHHQSSALFVRPRRFLTLPSHRTTTLY